MFDFPILMTLLVPVFIFFFTLYLQFRKDLDDIKNNSTISSQEKENKENNIRGKIILLFIITILIIFVILFMYKIYFVIDHFKNLNIYKISDIPKLLPDLFYTKKVTNPIYNFSYMVGCLFSILSIIKWFLELKRGVIYYEISDYIYTIIFLIIVIFSSLTLNNFSSLCLSYLFSFGHYRLALIFINFISFILFNVFIYFLLKIYDIVFDIILEILKAFFEILFEFIFG